MTGASARAARAHAPDENFAKKGTAPHNLNFRATSPPRSSFRAWGDIDDQSLRLCHCSASRPPGSPSHRLCSTRSANSADDTQLFDIARRLACRRSLSNLHRRRHHVDCRGPRHSPDRWRRPHRRLHLRSVSTVPTLSVRAVCAETPCLSRMYGWTLFQMAHYYQRSWRTDTLWLKVYVSRRSRYTRVRPKRSLG